MSDFRYGPFEIISAESIRLSGRPHTRQALRYGSEAIAERVLPADATQSAVIDAFADDIAEWRARTEAEHAPQRLHLVTHDGERLASFNAFVLPSGMSGCIPDDRFATWLITESRPMLGMPCTIEEFRAIKSAPKLGWECGLLPDDVLTSDPEQWRAPTSGEIRHVVGEGSLTGVPGAAAADLVGVTPQNFRKYTAADRAKNRQNISFAMWHLLLHKLGVKDA